MKRKYSVYVHGNTVRHGGTVKNLNRNNYVKTMNADPNSMIHSREAIRTRVLDALRTWVERFSGLGGL